MYRLKEDHMDEFEIKKSRFLCYLHRCNSEEEAKTFINKIKKEHPNARHHCYAFIIGEQNEIQRSNDDGEPAGTAGVPMLECLMKHQMQDIVAVTVRYFGGIKLGAGGLIRAYAKSVSHALESACLTRKQKMFVYTLHFPYHLIGKMDYLFRSHNIEVSDKQYQEDTVYTYLCEQPLDDEISEITNGAYLPVFIKECIIDVALQGVKTNLTDS